MKTLFTILTLIFLALDTTAQNINIPDPNFKAKLLNANINQYIALGIDENQIKIDVNNDHQIQPSEALAVYTLILDFSSINDLTGIEWFTNLKELRCNGNTINILDLSNNVNLENLSAYSSQIQQIDISGCHALRNLGIGNNQLTNLNLSNNSLLYNIYCQSNLLSDIDVSNLTELRMLNITNNSILNLDLTTNVLLRDLFCSDNQITNLNLQNQPFLRHFYCDNNQLTTLEFIDKPDLVNVYVRNNDLVQLKIQNCQFLYRLYCQNNLITNLNLENLMNLSYLDCSNNQLISLDVSNLISLNFMHSFNNELEYLNLKNGKLWEMIEFNGNDNLKYICVNENNTQDIQDLIDLYGYSNCNINSYCSYGPSQELYTIKGKVRYDYDNNGCDTTSVDFPQLKMRFQNHIGDFFTNSSGEYLTHLFAGNYNIHPYFGIDNQEFMISAFNYSPLPSTPISVTNVSDTLTKDFCVTHIQQYSNVDVSIISPKVLTIDTVIPIKLIYRNRGSNVESGTISLSYNNGISYDTANHQPSAELQNFLEWDFSNFLPFESREIDILFTPNNSNLLTLTATIEIQNTDQIIGNNTFQFNQIIPENILSSSKICLEGEHLSTNEIGDYVHYAVYFESLDDNTALEKALIVDEIDISKFDITTLTPIYGSHSFFTRVKDNKVHFIFDDLTSDNKGYLMFRIKTKSNLSLGDSISNFVNIHFGNNFPITTNTYTSYFSVLNIENVQLENGLKLFPNPTSHQTHLQFEASGENYTLQVIDLNGRIALEPFSGKKLNGNQIIPIEIDALINGMYTIRLYNGKEVGSIKLIVTK